MTKRAEFDPNVRVFGNDTYTGRDELPGAVVGEYVVLFEPEGGIEVDAWVTRVTGWLVYLKVDWDSLREMA